jgi:glycosyltransferase involved in cell wall biosynthesis
VSEPPGRAPGPDHAASPRLSVLIACWNAAPTIEAALASVLDERDVPLECVVVDDGSSDGTADVVADLAAGDHRIVLLRLERNEGVSAARNHGLDVARGEWLAFLDADDRLLPGAIAALMRPTVEPAVRAVIGQRVWTDGERTWLSPLYDISDIRQPGRKSVATHPGLLYYASATGKLLHRSLVGARRFEGRVLGDQPWTIHALLQAGDGIEVIGETVYEWRRPHPDRYVPTITAETRTSGGRAAEMAQVARSAWLEVAADVDALVPDEAARATVKTVYFERLVRSDIGDRLRAAADRRDPATPALYDAVGAFFEAVPGVILARTDVHLGLVVRSAAYRYSALRPASRRAFWRMVRPILARDDRSSRRLAGGYPPLAIAFALARRLGPDRGGAIGGLVLWPASVVARLARRIGLA